MCVCVCVVKCFLVYGVVVKRNSLRCRRGGGFPLLSLFSYIQLLLLIGVGRMSKCDESHPPFDNENFITPVVNEFILFLTVFGKN